MLMKAKSLLSCLILLFMAASLLGVAAWRARTNTAEVTVVNEANELIETCSIELAGKTAVIHGIAPGAQAFVVFDVGPKTDYDVTVQFIQGGTLHAKVGYVTRGFDYQDTISIRPASIELSARTLNEIKKSR